MFALNDVDLVCNTTYQSLLVCCCGCYNTVLLRYSEKTSEGRVSYLDLTLPQYGLPLYDWVISLEVAEHIPAESEAVFLDNIVRHAREGVVLSWAVPGNDLFLYKRSLIYFCYPDFCSILWRTNKSFCIY